ncbi:hypothetical protein ACIP5Y_21715 [Nocardia sp. NPDC088792]|uniref:hypothetical protein n=1 Tax=Nocardia sp. NPDC088792 TaxID=3364332 RepID=UPI0038222401
MGKNEGVDVSRILEELGEMPDYIKERVFPLIREHYREHPERLAKLVRRTPKPIS